MKVEKDYEELLKLFNRHKVRYCVIGAFAVAFHSKPRYTKDIDLLVEPSSRNSLKIMNALDEFGFGKIGLTPADFSKEGQIIQLGTEPVRIDIVTSIEGFSFKDVWKSRRLGAYGTARISIIGMKELIKNKKIANRPIDKIDVGMLEKFKGSKK